MDSARPAPTSLVAQLFTSVLAPIIACLEVSERNHLRAVDRALRDQSAGIPDTLPRYCRWTGQLAPAHWKTVWYRPRTPEDLDQMAQLGITHLDLSGKSYCQDGAMGNRFYQKMGQPEQSHWEKKFQRQPSLPMNLRFQVWDEQVITQRSYPLPPTLTHLRMASCYHKWFGGQLRGPVPVGLQEVTLCGCHQSKEQVFVPLPEKTLVTQLQEWGTSQGIHPPSLNRHLVPRSHGPESWHPLLGMRLHSWPSGERLFGGDVWDGVTAHLRIPGPTLNLDFIHSSCTYTFPGLSPQERRVSRIFGNKEIVRNAFGEVEVRTMSDSPEVWVSAGSGKYQTDEQTFSFRLSSLDGEDQKWKLDQMYELMPENPACTLHLQALENGVSVLSEIIWEFVDHNLKVTWKLSRSNLEAWHQSMTYYGDNGAGIMVPGLMVSDLKDPLAEEPFLSRPKRRRFPHSRLFKSARRGTPITRKKRVTKNPHPPRRHQTAHRAPQRRNYRSRR